MDIVYIDARDNKTVIGTTEGEAPEANTYTTYDGADYTVLRVNEKGDSATVYLAPVEPSAAQKAYLTPLILAQEKRGNVAGS